MHWGMDDGVYTQRERERGRNGECQAEWVHMYLSLLSWAENHYWRSAIFKGFPHCCYMGRDGGDEHLKIEMEGTGRNQGFAGDRWRNQRLQFFLSLFGALVIQYFLIKKIFKFPWGWIRSTEMILKLFILHHYPVQVEFKFKNQVLTNE